MDIGDKTSYKKAYQQYLEKLGASCRKELANLVGIV